MKNIFTTLIFTAAIGNACETLNTSIESHFVINSETRKIELASQKNSAFMNINKCTQDIKFLGINISNIYYKGITLKNETDSGRVTLGVNLNNNLNNKINNNNQQSKVSCSVKGDSELTRYSLTDSDLNMQIQSNIQFARKCLKALVTSTKPLIFDSRTSCLVQYTNESKTSAIINADMCILPVDKSTDLQIKLITDTSISECSQSLSVPRDIESVLKVWPLSFQNGDFVKNTPIGQRFVRHTILPKENFLPRATKEDETSIPFVSALSTNLEQGPVTLQKFGNKKFQIKSSYIVANASKEYCLGSECAKISSFTAPIAGSSKLFIMSSKNQQLKLLADWQTAFKVPAHFVGQADTNFSIYLGVGNPNGTVMIEGEVNPGDEVILETRFYEPRGFMDESGLSAQFSEAMSTNFDISNEQIGDHLISLPKLDYKMAISKIPSLPVVGLGLGLEEDFFKDLFNTPKTWTHKYNMICSPNLETKKCEPLKDLSQPFISLRTRFILDENNQLIVKSIEKASTIFETYKKDIQKLPTYGCE